MKKIKRIIAILLVATFICCLYCCGRPEFYSEKHHELRVRKGLERRERGKKDFDLYPVYNQEEKLTHFLLEGQSNWFTFITIKSSALSCLNSYKMYQFADVIWNEDDTIREEMDEKYDNSPYYECNYMEERKYLLQTNVDEEYVCAIKKNDVYLNLISGETFVVEKGRPTTKQETIKVHAFFKKTL